MGTKHVCIEVVLAFNKCSCMLASMFSHHLPSTPHLPSSPYLPSPPHLASPLLSTSLHTTPSPFLLSPHISNLTSTLPRIHREALRRANSPRRLRAAPPRPTSDPLSTVRVTPFTDSRSLLQRHKSPLGASFPPPLAYTAALVLEAYLDEAGGEGEEMQLSLLYRQVRRTTVWPNPMRVP